MRTKAGIYRNILVCGIKKARIKASAASGLSCRDSMKMEAVGVMHSHTAQKQALQLNSSMPAKMPHKS